MPRNSGQADIFLKELFRDHNGEELLAQLTPDTSDLPRPVLPGGSISPRAVAKRWRRLGIPNGIRERLYDPDDPDHPRYEGNIENYVGKVSMPLGLAGPLRVNGLFAQGDYLLPLATTEAALVASYHRGTILLNQAGGCSSLLLAEGVSRAPGFAFANARESGQFVTWVLAHRQEIAAAAESTTRHGTLADLRITLEGNHVYLIFEFRTGDAAGQNMVTIATDAACTYILSESPVKPAYSFVEANMSGDKKASALSFQNVRGRHVSAEAIISSQLIEHYLHTTPERMADYWRMSAIGGVLSGTIGVQGHYANGLAALYIACGQDAACIAESAVGVTRFELCPDGLYASVTLPNLIVGTVGGGTGLPTQRACLELMRLSGTGKAKALAEVCAGLALAGELSIIGALAAGHFTRAHNKLARQRGNTHD